MSESKIYLGERKIYNAGNSKNFTIPSALVKKIESSGQEIEKAEIWYDIEKKEIMLKIL